MKGIYEFVRNRFISLGNGYSDARFDSGVESEIEVLASVISPNFSKIDTDSENQLSLALLEMQDCRSRLRYDKKRAEIDLMYAFGSRIYSFLQMPRA